GDRSGRCRSRRWSWLFLGDAIELLAKRIVGHDPLRPEQAQRLDRVAQAQLRVGGHDGEVGGAAVVDQRRGAPFGGARMHGDGGQVGNVGRRAGVAVADRLPGVDVVQDSAQTREGEQDGRGAGDQFVRFHVEPPLVLWMSGVVVNYNTDFRAVKGKFGFDYMTDGLWGGGIGNRE